MAATHAGAGDVVVDLCCGSGAVGLAVAVQSPGIELYAADIDAAAVRCAERNVAAVGGRVRHGDLYDALPQDLRGAIKVLVVNAPYVPTESINRLPPEARDHEPRIALDGGADGLDILRRVAASARGWLAPDGCLVIETGDDQSDTTAAVVTESGLRASVVRSADLDATAVIAARPG
jgi:release factor glutamine methyltransferase